MRYAYYPGCTAKGSTAEADVSTKAVARRLGIELVDLTEATCCGSCELKVKNPALNAAVNARTFALAERLDLDIVTICDTCQFTFSEVLHDFRTRPASLTRANEGLELLGMRFAGAARIRHLLEILFEDVGVDSLRVDAGRLANLRVAPFACCHFFRPEVMRARGPAGTLASLITALGAEMIPARTVAHCCGFHALLVNKQLAVQAAARFLGDAKRAGADCVVTSSPLCHVALDIYQADAARLIGEPLNMPILHLAQFVGLALGLPERELALHRHFVSTVAVTAKIRFTEPLGLVR